MISSLINSTRESWHEHATSGLFVQFFTLQTPAPSKYVPVTGTHLVKVQVNDPSNIQLSCMQEQWWDRRMCPHERTSVADIYALVLTVPVTVAVSEAYTILKRQQVKIQETRTPQR